MTRPIPMSEPLALESENMDFKCMYVGCLPSSASLAASAVRTLPNGTQSPDSSDPARGMLMRMSDTSR